MATIQELSEEVVLAAYAWFAKKKPVQFTREEHLRLPSINTTTDAEKRLAQAVAARILAEK